MNTQESFAGVTRAIDLCSAPGSWTQVIYNKLHNVLNNYDPSKLNPNVKIVSVDMMPMHNFPGVVHLKADISQYSTMKAILDEFNNVKADIVVCDGAIDGKTFKFRSIVVMFIERKNFSCWYERN